MKRIITAGIWSLAVAVFFTGCSSLAGSAQVDIEEIRSSAEAEAVTDENGENRLGITGERQEMPDYFRQNMTDKFKDLEGKRAFRIKEGHSQESGDMEGFQIGGLRSDKTFIYGYVTRADDTGESKKLVHCGAFYNYDTEDFQVFHENIYEREEEGEESFVLQVSETTGEVFVYDNGHGYLYDSGGNLKFHGDIEGFVREHFAEVYAVSVINAVTDWQRRIYLELSIEKEKIDIPEPDGEDSLEEALKNRGSGEAGEDSQELDEELEGKVESRVMVYQYQDINSGMDQNNEAFEIQKAAWIAMTDGQEFESAPSIRGDWQTVVNNIPDVWGDAFLGGFENAPVYQWKESAVFGSEDGVTTFLPAANSYIRFRDVKAGWELENLFIPIKDKYSGLFGKTGSFRYYNPQEIKRRYTLVTYEETEREGEDGETVTETVKHTYGRVQTIRGIYASRYAPLQNAYVESYFLLDPEKAVSLGKCIGNEIMCWGGDGKVRWIQPGGELKDTPYQVTDDTENGEYTEAGAYVEDGVVYHVEYGRKGMAVVRDAAHGGNGDEAPLQILYGNLAGGFQPGETVYDQMFEDSMAEGLEEGESIYGNDYFTEDQVLHGELNVDLALAAELMGKGGDGICKMAAGPGRTGFLLTSQGKGLIFYSPFTGESAVLESGTWFRTWKSGGDYISVGFPNGVSSYGTNDVAFSRVYEYNLGQLCNESMKKSLEDILAAEEEQRESEAMEESLDQSGEGEEAEEDETDKSPMDRWNQEFQQKYDREDAESE